MWKPEFVNYKPECITEMISKQNVGAAAYLLLSVYTKLGKKETI